MSPEFKERSVCGYCGEYKRCARLILAKPACELCRVRFARVPKTCPGCGEVKVLAFYDSDGRAACAACTGAKPVYGCATCGREDSHFGTRCGPCVLSERATALLADATGQVRPELQPVFEALMAARRPRSVLYWFHHSSGPAILRAMATGEIEISHGVFDRLPHDKAAVFVHELLATVGVLSPFNSRLEQVTPWLKKLLRPLPKDQAEIIARFAKWQIVRRLRNQDHRGVLTPSSIENGRAEIITAVRLLAWLSEHNKTLATAGQADLELYLVSYPRRGEVLFRFLTWANRTKLTAGLELPKWRQWSPLVELSDDDRWRQVELLLHDESLRLNVRVPGLFMLLFAQPLTRISRMKTSQVTHESDGPVTVNFDSFPIELPEPLDRLVVEQLDTEGLSSYAKHTDPWLFPGGTPGKHVSTETIRAQLVARGIKPSNARKAAMFQLASEIPTPVLAEILGLGTNTAVRWATLAARDWSQYTALRRLSQEL